jgi:hypothetical protein
LLLYEKRTEVTWKRLNINKKNWFRGQNTIWKIYHGVQKTSHIIINNSWN